MSLLHNHFFKGSSLPTQYYSIFYHKNWDEAFSIAKNLKHDVYQRGLASMIYKFFDKKSSGSGVNIPLESNEKLAEELHKPIISKF